MNFAVLGTGMVGKTVAGKLKALGHDVVVGTRDPVATLARSAPGAFGDPPIATWQAETGVPVVTLAEAATHGEIVVLATSGEGALGTIAGAGPERLAGKVLIDISNPLDFSKGMPPLLFVSNDDSLGEQVQKAAPKARVVKTLNTVNALLMVDPGQLAGGDHTMFVAGNDAEAKGIVTGILTEGFGWKDVIDLGDITMARGTEQLLPLWVRVWGATQNPMFSFKVVR